MLKRAILVVALIILPGCAIKDSPAHRQPVFREESAREYVRDAGVVLYLQGAVYDVSESRARQVVLQALVPDRRSDPTRKGCIMGRLVFFWKDVPLFVTVFDDPTWIKVENAYYRLTPEELRELREITESAPLMSKPAGVA